MAEFPYATVTGKISEILDKIREVGVPAKATQQWLQSVGFTSTNDRSLIPVLKFIGFTDDSGAPTSRWRDYRGAESGAILAEGVKQGYKDLFDTYPQANSQSDQDLQSFFSTRSDAGSQVISKTVTTFKNLCAKADFSAQPPTFPADSAAGTKPLASGKSQVGATPVSINIKLELPPADAETYDAFFKSMKKHLLS